MPFSKVSASYLQEYIYDHRSQLTKTSKQSALLISSHTGKAMGHNSIYSRLKYLVKTCEEVSLQDKSVGLHTLRHSIATHLLQAGMSLEKIQKFLGHSSLESTQIYTHLIEKI